MTINAAPWTFRVSFSNGKLQRLRSKARVRITKKSEDIESVPATKLMWDTAFAAALEEAGRNLRTENGTRLGLLRTSQWLGGRPSLTDHNRPCWQTFCWSSSKKTSSRWYSVYILRSIDSGWRACLLLFWGSPYISHQVSGQTENSGLKAIVVCRSTYLEYSNGKVYEARWTVTTKASLL